MDHFVFTEFEKMCSSLSQFEWSSEFDKVQWIVTEKIHGANMSFHTDGNDVAVARRRDFVKDESFFGYKKADFMKTYPEKVKEVFNLVVDHVGNVDISQVAVYGEIFGGRYTHKDYTATPTKGKPIQSEIQYCPGISFCAFDISYRTENANHKYIDYEVAMRMFDQVGIMCAKPLFTGKVNECIHYELGFNSTIPALFKLPAFENGANKAEGIVVKPLREITAKTKSNFEERAILKVKLPEFLEFANTKQSNDYKKGSTAVKNVSGRPDRVLMPMMIAYINANRITSGVTKIGFPDTDEKKTEVANEVYSDVIFDCLAGEDGAEKLWNACDEKQRKNIEKCLRAKILSGIRKHCDAMAAENDTDSS